MSDTIFLRSIAEYYAANTAERPSAEDLVYVMPNKRSAMFLKKYVRETVHDIAFMPRFVTIRSFLSQFSTYPEASQREQLFILYNAYRRTLNARGRADGIREFDSFIFWGDMMLADFDDIDKSLVNADELFKNLKNIKEIQANYLDNDQKEIIRRIWGESRLTANIETFWNHISPDNNCTELSSKFLYLWEILSDVYHEYHQQLTKQHLSSTGMQYREALAKLKDTIPGDTSNSTHYVFIGFNDLSTVEVLIFDRLKELKKASFFWDTSPMMHIADDGNAIAKPLIRLRELVRHFPMPDDYTMPLPDGAPKINVYAIPSNTGQAKAVHRALSIWSKKKYIDTDNPLNTAIILPDQGLLLPTLLSIPEDISKINISMGLAYRTTTFASLFSSIISMQLRARMIHGAIHYFYEDVTAVLFHPHIQLIARQAADNIKQRISNDKLYNISARDIIETEPMLASVFAPVHDLNNVADVASYLITLFDWLEQQLSNNSGGNNTRTFEIKAIKFFRDEVESLKELVERYEITMSDRTFLLLFERIFNSRGLTVNGTPLQGLQLLGVLETRALDFENIIILSMNENVFPRKQYTKTMIPGSLRSGFGLPDFDSLEWTYAYCFYRLIARAKRVVLFYDSRSDGLGNGEVSRYISQMLYIMPWLKVDTNSVNYNSRPDSHRCIEIAKTDDVMKSLNRFKKGGSLRLSASALKVYKHCPMRFYLEYARTMRDNDELVDYISPAEFGTVVHNVIQHLYQNFKNKLITSDTIDDWLRPDNNTIDDIARKLIIKERYPKAKNPEHVTLSAEATLACQLVTSIARANLVAEKELYCSNGNSFTFIENELKVNDVWHIDDDLDINFYMSIDRVDQINANTLRFIDFKTGDDEYWAQSIDGLFSRESHKKDGIFQLFTYCEAYNAMVNPDVEILPVLHSMRQLSAGEKLSPIKISSKAINAYSEYREVFRAQLKELVKEIFDPSISIRQCEKVTNCTFCPFQTLCGRISVKN